MKKARFWERRNDDKVACRLCPHGCVMASGERGLCEIRENRNGTLMSLVYGHPAAKAVDPIEKKPLYHVLPGSRAFSIGTVGCNLRCLHCQNCSLSQTTVGIEDMRTEPVAPGTLVQLAKAQGCRSIAYTYNEPIVFLEYAHDIMQQAHAANLKNLFVTNGFASLEAIAWVAPYLDAANIDLKFFDATCHREVTGAPLQPVLDAIKYYHALGVWIEITTLVIPGYNDDATQLRGIADFIAGIDPGIPWHVTAFRPAYKLLDARMAGVKDLDKAEVIGREAGLQHIYHGNVSDAANTVCAECGALLIARQGMGLRSQHLEGDQCPRCGTQVGGVWK